VDYFAGKSGDLSQELLDHLARCPDCMMAVEKEVSRTVKAKAAPATVRTRGTVKTKKRRPPLSREQWQRLDRARDTVRRELGIASD
jgi:hypothetical protein